MAIWNIIDFDPGEISELHFPPPAIRLWKTAPGAFLVIEPGAYLPVLYGHNYSLIRKEYERVLAPLTDQLRMAPATISDGVKGTINEAYVSLEIFHTITPDSISSEDDTGKKIWTYSGALFASDALKAELEALPGSELKFIRGFQWWG